MKENNRYTIRCCTYNDKGRCRRKCCLLTEESQHRAKERGREGGREGGRKSVLESEREIDREGG